jgi:hypothetical protein
MMTDAKSAAVLQHWGAVAAGLQEYRIYVPPPNALLPPDGRLRELVAALPAVAVVRCQRYDDRDSLFVTAPNGGILSARAKASDRQKVKAFLVRLGHEAVAFRLE